MEYLPKEPDSNPVIVRVCVEHPTPVDLKSAEVRESAFELAKYAALKAYILKGQRAEFTLVSVEGSPRIPGKPIEKAAAGPGGVRVHVLGEEKSPR